MSNSETLSFQAKVLTLFPEMFPGPLGASLIGKARREGLWGLETVDIRDFATDKHGTVDDTPFGGGAGMVVRPDVIDQALCKVHSRGQRLVCLTPRGRLFNQRVARDLSESAGVTLVCGRYEGIDQRVIEKWDMDELSVGDFIISGGESAAIIVLDAVIRLLPGVVGCQESLVDESFETGLLEYPQYTRPMEWKNVLVPEILLSGHHKNIKDWRQCQSENITRERRPDLWQAYRDTTVKDRS